jgi:hypothetical protein
MPYAIAHPVAVIPLCRALGRRAVPSALVIGSVIPDAWYLVPGLDRPFSHDASGLLLFCLPAGLLCYLLFHALLKEPLLQLFPVHLASRLRAFACQGLPKISFPWVVPSLVMGAATHVAWDAFTHQGRLSRLLPLLTEDVLRVLQHGSTLLGTLFLGWWAWRKLHEVPPVPADVLPAGRRLAVLVALGVVTFVAAASAFPDVEDLRKAVRVAAVAGAAALGLGALAYAALFPLIRNKVSARKDAIPSPAVTDSAAAPKRESSTSKRNGAIA